MRVFIYKLLTLLIIVLNLARKKVWWFGVPWELRKDRDEQNLIAGYYFSKGNGILIECCDCGLSHRFYEDERGAHCIPERPKGYDYKWRLGQ